MAAPLLHRATRRLRREQQFLMFKARARLTRLSWDLPETTLRDLAGADSVDLAPAILEDAGVPPYAGTSDHDDLLPILTIARSLQPRIIVELGTSYGNLTANFCRQCPASKVYTVNALPEQQTGTIVTHSLATGQIGRVYRTQWYSAQVVQTFINTRDLDLSSSLQGPLVDLAVIDACHDTDYVIGDFQKLRPFMRPGGLVLFHDTHPSMRDHLAGSYMACMLLRREGHDVRHLKNTWWAAWRATASSDARGTD
jgi:predicted O-methyltransferase YrrM